MKKGLLVISIVLLILILGGFYYWYSTRIPEITIPVGSPACSETKLSIEGASTIGNQIQLEIKRDSKENWLGRIVVRLWIEGKYFDEVFSDNLPPHKDSQIYLAGNETSDYSSVEKIEVAPVVFVGNTEMTCEVTDSIIL